MTNETTPISDLPEELNAAQETEGATTPLPEPAAVEPAAVEPAAVEPAAVEPAAVEPATVEPAAVEPAAVEPVAVEAEAAAEQAPGEEKKDDGKRRPRRKPRLSDEEAKPLWDELTAAKEAGEIIPMMCTRSIPGGAIVEYKGIEGFIPRSQFLGEGRAEQTDIDACAGQELGVVVIEVSDLAARKFVCSRRKALKREQYKSIKKGDVLEGTVTSIASYGVFVDLGGVDGLIHVSRLSKVRVASPSDAVKLHERVKVRVVDVDPKNERIALSMKEFAESPWQHVVELYPQGSTQKGRVRNITDFGVYVQLEPGIVGMIHISDLSWTRRLQHPSELVKTGQELTVKVLDVKAADKRIALSLKATQPDPWPRLGNIYPAGTEASGTVKRVMDAGAIVTLDYDVDCFVPRGKMGARRRGGRPGGKPEPLSVSIGDTVRIKVIEMDVDKHSFIAAIMREEDHDSHSSDQKDGFGSAHSASDRAFTLGELAGLQSLFATATEPEAEAPAAPEAVAEAPEAVAEAPEAVAETPEAVAETPEAVAETPEAVAEAPEAVAETPEAVAEAPEAVAEAPEAVAEAPEAVAEAPEAVAEAPEAVAEAPEPPAEDAPAAEESGQA